MGWPIPLRKTLREGHFFSILDDYTVSIKLDEDSSQDFEGRTKSVDRSVARH